MNEIANLVSHALDKVSKVTGLDKDCFCKCVPQIPETFIPGEDVAVYGRYLGGDILNKSIKDLANGGNNFANAVELLLARIYDSEWHKHVIYGNVTLIADVDGGKGRLNKTMFDAQYDEVCKVYNTVQDTYHPRITFLFTGNTGCESVFDRIDFNQPLFESYHNIVGFKELGHYDWGYRNDGIPHTITLFQSNDGPYFLELECPGVVTNDKHAEAILDVLKRNNVI